MRVILTILFCSLSMHIFSQGLIKGQTYLGGDANSITLTLTPGNRIIYSEPDGSFAFDNVAFGKYQLIATFFGYSTKYIDVALSEVEPQKVLDIRLEALSFGLDDVVVTGTKTFQHKTESPVFVNVINAKTLANVQACNLAEGLKMQPGLRVETNCQTCNYTQLRMNGLAGGYTQILVNGRPIFAPLMGLYGLEQFSTNLVERIEVVRGGGSSLYGSSAVGGTVNVITRNPSKNEVDLEYSLQQIDGGTNDHVVNGNIARVTDSKNAGIGVHFNYRNRGFNDQNGDNFSELPLLESVGAGLNAFYNIGKNQDLNLSFDYLSEFRLGGDMRSGIATAELEQVEERSQGVGMLNLDYQITSSNKRRKLHTYVAFQQTNRTHLTGILPDMPAEREAYIRNPPTGESLNTTYQIGLQYNQTLSRKGDSHIGTIGVEYLEDKVLDEIPAYRYFVDQHTQNVGFFAQSDWKISPKVTLLSGFRWDYHNQVDQLVFSPRVSLLYKPFKNWQFRANYGTGYKAPQAFDADLHIAFAGGGISRIRLADDLMPEFSQSLNASINYDKATAHWVSGFTVEGFYTVLDNAFALQVEGSDAFGELLVKDNTMGAIVSGITIEGRMNFDQKIQLETGFTLQQSQFDEPIRYFEDVDPLSDFVRTPNAYGFANLSIFPNSKWKGNINYVFTGSMLVPHFGGAANQAFDEIITSQSFHELSLKVSRTFTIRQGQSIELYVGGKNILNSYQNDFDIGKDRDSNFIYGPALPRSVFLGIKWRWLDK